MNLENIKEKECPVCGARTCSETKDNKHTNGYYNESRSFACGAKIEFSPNFMKSEMSKYHQCPYTPEILEIRERRKKATERLTSYISRMRVDKKFKEKMINEVELRARIMGVL